MSDLNPTVFQEHEQACQCPCEQQTDFLTELRNLRNSLAAKCPGVEIAVGFRIEPKSEFYYIKVGREYVFGTTLDEVKANAEKISNRISSPDYQRAVQLKKESDELFSKVVA